MRYRNRGRTCKRFAAFGLVVFVAALCMNARQVTAATTFYDAYEVGLAHERVGRWAAASAAFQEAIDLRPEAGREVPTFGRDVLAVYDPYLHLARVEMELGEPEAARRHLELARSAGVSPPREIAALAARLDDHAVVATRSTNVPPTPMRPVAAEPTRRPTEPETATAVTEQPTAAPTSTGTATPIETAAGEEPDAGRAPGAEAGEGEPGSGGGLVLLAVIAAAAVLFVLRRRRTDRRVEKQPDYDTTPTRRVETGTGRAAPAAPVSTDSGAGVVVGGYRLLDRLGRGGMATTYRARSAEDDRVVVVKIPHEHLLDDAEFAERFLREGALGATIHHPNIIRVFEAGEHEGRPFIAMELVEGETLEARLARRGALPPSEALEIARGIALALDYAHVKGVVHRDVKPDNVMVLADGSVKVMDFGIARVAATPGLTATNTYLGTPLYSAPEAIDPDQVGPQSDLYSLGIVLYRMLSNRAPFEAPSPLKVVELHRTAPLPPFAPELGVPAPVEAMVRRLTAKRMTDRTPSAEAFLNELNGYLTGSHS